MGLEGPITGSTEGSRPNRQLDQAIRHVSDGWIPVSGTALQKVREQLRASSGEVQRPALLRELKRDFALFAYCVRELARKTLGKNKSSSSDPESLFANASDDDLRTILVKDASSISPHRLSEISEPQANQLKQAMISATVAEALSEISSVDSLTAYSTGLLRQLGLTLISWNYPHVFKRVLGSLEPGVTLDDGLNRFLGFSPTMLGVRIAREWGLSPVIRASMGDSNAKAEVNQAGGAAASKLLALDKICRIGETLAAVSEPSTAPNPIGLTAARGEIEEMLGRDAFRMLREKIAESCTAYAEFAPHAFKSASPVTSSAIKLNKTAEALYRNNVYLKHCPEQIRDELRELYLRLDGVTIVKDNVDFLVRQVMPLAGFTRGCIYLIDPESNRLLPRLAIGIAQLKDFRAVNFNSTSSTYDPVASAFRCSTPIMEENVNLGNGSVTYIAGALGELQKAGVLYLELDNAIHRENLKNPLLVYKALRTALCDCLGVH